MAYASVASLMRTIESLLTSNSPMQSLICDHREEFCALHEKVSSLEVFLMNFEKINISEEMTDFEVQVKEVANVVEYIIQLRLTETVMGENKSQGKKARRRFRQSLKQVAEDIDRICKESKKIQDKGKQASKESLVQDFSSSANDILNVKNTMVGRDDQRERLLEDLTRSYSSELKIIPIIGMGGIGKTTLAKEVYNDVSILSRFDVRAWATVSQQYNVKEIMLSLLRSTKRDTFDMNDEAEIADMLQKSLKGKRYLIVLDDMWKIEAWDDVRLCFPNETNGSGILLTTRNAEVASYAGTENLSLQMSFMNQVESWNLFESIAFANEALPYEFETIVKQIVDKCQGLPLTIVVVAGLLFKSKRTTEDWESVAKDVVSFVTNDPDEQCSRVLRLSYNHLTSDLKSCLLYFGVFPEDSEISVKKLVRLWIAEGFLKLEKDFEGEAEKCLQDLVDRCLVLVSKKSFDELKIKSCKVHDLIYDLCLTEAQSQNVFVMKDIFAYRGMDVDDYDSYRALLTPGHHHSIKTQLTYDEDNSLWNQTRSLFYISKYSPSFTPERSLIHFNLLRILDLSSIWFERFPPVIMSLIWLRYLAMSGIHDIPTEICWLWSLQTFIVESYNLLESKNVSETIWELMQLRHLRLGRFKLPNPPSTVSIVEERHLFFSNVQTISGLSPCSCRKEVISGIPNVKRLGIHGNTSEYKTFQEDRLFDNLVTLHQLETLSFERVATGWLFDSLLGIIPCAKAFPAALKKLTLKGTYLRWKYMDIIGELPNLEILKLKSNACWDRKWHPTAGGFTRLKFLRIVQSNLKYWKATNDNFPVLERLVIRECSLEEIPIEFADIYSLQLIELTYCTIKVRDSAARIQQEQEDIGNKPVDVLIGGSSWDTISTFSHQSFQVLIAFGSKADMAYASIASLIRTMELLLTSDLPMLSLTSDHREEIIALHTKVSSIEVFLKNSDKQISNYSAMTDLEARIKDFANVAEDIIEFGLREAMIAEDEMQRGKACMKLRESLQRVSKDIDRVQQESKKILGSQASTWSLAHDTSSEKLPNLEVSDNMVGRDKEKKTMLEVLRRGSSDELKVIPIVGMGGIGKTTLAKQVFNHPSIQSHFDVRAWATISKEYNVREILLSLLQCIINIDDKVYSVDEAELADLLQKKLKRKRYLIVMDDIWSDKAWDDTRQCFPIDDNGSRILLTTRLTEVAIYASSSNLSLKMSVMNSDESWNLFKSKAFANESFPSELETIGEKIAQKCQGLPLTIVVVAGLLSKSKRTKEEWENVAENIKLFVTKDPDEQCLRVLGLSYNYLPNDLKACLLYFGIFSEDSEISVKRLVRLWIAEGFLKLEGDLEEEAENHLQDLVDRCLVLVSQRSADGRKMKTCRIHDLVHELCLRESQSQNILFIRNDKTESVPHVGCRWISIQKRRQTGVDSQDEHWFRSLTHKHRWLIRTPTDDDNSPWRRIRSIFLFAAPSRVNSSNFELGHLNLIGVLDLSSMYFLCFPQQILCLFLLRYLSFSTHISFGIPQRIRKLLNLQTFIIRGPVSSFIKFPELIWETTQLRHLKLRNFYLPDPPSSSIDEERNLVWSNIQSVSGLIPYCCTKKVLSRIRNIKKLCIRGHVYDYRVHEEDMNFRDLADLHQLEALSIKVDRYQVSHWSSRFHKSPVYVPNAIHFPTKLKKLKLVGTRLPWEDLNIIGQWTNLEVLKLKPNACRGLEWRPIEGGFPRLKFLLIEGTNLKCWKATNDHFPALEHLVIRHCFHLEEIPIEFADIYSLQLIELQNCNAKLVASARQIQEEQESLGSEAVDVRSYNDPAECEQSGSDSDSD